jgi:PAS domain S-box-containing protein
LVQKNDELNELNEELTATQEELHQNIEELTRAEKELRESETRHRRFYESGLVGVIYWDMDGVITDANDKFLAITGYTREDLAAGRIDWIAMTPPEYRYLDEDSARELKASGVNARPFEKEYIRRDGTRVPIIIAGAMLDEARFKGVAFVLDITERKLDEKKIRESEERYRLVADFTYDWEFLVDPDGNLRYISPSADRITGRPVSREKSLEALLRKVSHPDDLDERLAHLVAEKSGGDVFEMEYRIIRPDGEVRWLHHICQPVYSAEGDFLGTRGSNRDITERKLIEEQLQATLKRFYHILAGMPYGILLVTDEDRVEFANQAFCDFFDLVDSPADLLNLSAHEIIGKIRSSYQDPVTAVARIGEIVRLGVPVRDEDVAMRSGRAFLRDFTPILMGEKRYGRLWIHMDITSRRKAEEELIRKNDDLNSLNEELTSTQEELHQNIDELSRREQDLGKALAEKEVLLSEIHHRVKNNLTAFISLLSLEGSTEDTPAGKLLKQDLQNRARSMALIHETLYRTNMYDEVDMGIYLTTLVDQIENSFRTTKGVKTVVDAHGVMLDIPRATPAGLIINELVTNSFKYAFPDSFDSAVVRKSPPTITVMFAKDGEEYVLTVSDNGIGLPPGFDMTKTKTLGLKLVNFLAKHQMGAEVEIRANKGTEFVFRFRVLSPDGPNT